MTVIVKGFKDEYSYLSNAYPCSISYGELYFDNLESAFRSFLCADKDLRKQFCSLTAPEARQLGYRALLRSGWASYQDQLMYEVVRAKFTQNEKLGLKLCLTGNAKLVAEEEYFDEYSSEYWGTYLGVGQNKLGKILMRVRKELLEKVFSCTNIRCTVKQNVCCLLCEMRDYCLENRCPYSIMYTSTKECDYFKIGEE